MVADSKRRATVISLLYTEVIGPINAALARADAMLPAMEAGGALSLFEAENVQAMKDGLAHLQAIMALPQVAWVAEEYKPGHLVEPHTIGLED